MPDPVLDAAVDRIIEGIHPAVSTHLRQHSDSTEDFHILVDVRPRSRVAIVLFVDAALVQDALDLREATDAEPILSEWMRVLKTAWNATPNMGSWDDHAAQQFTEEIARTLRATGFEGGYDPLTTYFGMQRDDEARLEVSIFSMTRPRLPNPPQRP